MFCRMQGFHAIDPQHIHSSPPDFSPHFVKEILQIHNLGLPGGIMNECRAFGENGRHHDILSRANTRDIEIDVRTLQAIRPGLDIAVLFLHLNPEILKPFEMLIHRTGADGTPTGHRNFHPPVTGQDWAKN